MEDVRGAAAHGGVLAVADTNAILAVRNLSVGFIDGRNTNLAVDNVDLTLRQGETLGVVGESGCGKSVTALSIMRLVPCPPGRIVGGSIMFEGRDLLKLDRREIRRIRGNRISMIFQEPMTSLNPVYTVGDQVLEAIRLHQHVGVREARERTIDMFKRVGIALPERRIDEYPHKLSGGMRQRVMIAMALATNPTILIADEPTTALDVTIQAQILDLMNRLQEETGAAIILITHDLGVIADAADRVVVMYAGRIAEEGPVRSVFKEPLHPYTEGLLRAIPHVGNHDRLPIIPGVVPEVSSLPKGCRFHPRCPYVKEICKEEEPRLSACGGERTAACWLERGQGGTSCG